MRMYFSDFNDKFKPFWAKWGKIIALIWAVTFFIVAHAEPRDHFDEMYKAPYRNPQRMTTPDHVTFVKYCLVSSKTHSIHIKTVNSIGLKGDMILVEFLNDRMLTMSYNDNTEIARLAYQELKTSMDVCAFYNNPFEK